MGAKDIKPYGDLLHEAKLHGGVEPLIRDIETGGIAKGLEQGRTEGRYEGTGIGVALAAATFGLALFIKTKIDDYKAKKETDFQIERGEAAKQELSETLTRKEQINNFKGTKNNAEEDASNTQEEGDEIIEDSIEN